MKVRRIAVLLSENYTKPPFETHPMVPLTLDIPIVYITLYSLCTTSQQLESRYNKHQTMVQILRASYMLREREVRRKQPLL